MNSSPHRPGQAAHWEHALVRQWQRRGVWFWAMLPLSWVMRFLVSVRQWLYRKGFKPVWRSPLPVIVVGNVTVGGGGKTPTVIALIEHLRHQGWRVGVVSRGYGRRDETCRAVGLDSVVEDVGDEPLLIHRRTGVPVQVARQRAQAAQALLQREPELDLLVCDDGLQHLALARDFEICVFDERGIGNGQLLPAGPLREPWPRPVDLVLHTGRQPAFAGFRSTRQLAPHAVRQDGARLELSSLQGQNMRVIALAGIAHPTDFFDMLRAAQVRVDETIALPDHHDFSNWQPPGSEPCIVLCTEKDAAKLWRVAPQAWAVPLQFAPESAFFAAFDQWLQTRPRTPLSSRHGQTSA